jgi:L-seryl-tRNA(Ser) seleniumtransferase
MTTPTTSRESLRNLPAVERVLQHPEVVEAIDANNPDNPHSSEPLPRELVAESTRRVLDEIRTRVLAGEELEADLDYVVGKVLALARTSALPGLQPVINATGVVLHTNLGRAPLPECAVLAMGRAAGYCNLEFDLETGARGYRHEAVAPLLCELTGAEAALVVNNNAAAVLLVLAALAKDREVVVSRGEMVEVGGSFRIPDVMTQSGAILREVGSTNKTRASDYASAVGSNTAALMKVHTSNYRVMGFTEGVALEELVAVGRDYCVPVIEDLGSGYLIPLAGMERLEEGGEPDVRSSVASGADLVTFSGDKLLGGPQAGIIVGKREAVEACARHPLMRALRPDKVTFAALEAVLMLYRDPRRALREVPTLRMLAQSGDTLNERAAVLAEAVRGALGEVGGASVDVEVVDEVSQAGGGTLPLIEFPSRVVEVKVAGGGLNVVSERLRQFTPPVIARVREDALVLDPRTLQDNDFQAVAAALAFALEASTESSDD